MNLSTFPSFEFVDDADFSLFVVAFTLKRKTKEAPDVSDLNGLSIAGLISRMSPLINLRSCLTIESPKPLPPYFLVNDPSAWVKLSKINCCLSSGTPIPVSVTIPLIKKLSSVPLGSVSASKLIEIPPFSVNLIEFETKLITNCFILVGSPITASGIRGSKLSMNCKPFSLLRY